MCMSRLHQVVGDPEEGRVEVIDIDGTRHSVSLLALDGPAPVDGEWLVVHSGYAIDRVGREEAEAVAAELRTAMSGLEDEGMGKA